MSDALESGAELALADGMFELGIRLPNVARLVCVGLVTS